MLLGTFDFFAEFIHKHVPLDSVKIFINRGVKAIKANSLKAIEWI